ncbi:MAG TPA: UDP-N-acetylmuramoyl-L-alanyl-D-glutamate--2,6-diaminopimelate ligase [Mycobacteriales bacterium]|jgi:UDP-N-acetylmuramoyl-L-alanyl-D-glutamate--2,6-diaminopimelate ligase|nr:UDP-N-acetylmuramoyl-L-alanyl-D-glutamate--2,6-diaminopimelate ligase [Mycobacteriales bacterium]
MPDLPPRPHTVPPQHLGALLDRLPGSRIDGDPMTVVTGVTHDSRLVRAGDLYIARAGEQSHGIDHVAAAIDAGAVAVLTDPASEDRAVEAHPAAVVVVPDPRAAMGPAAAWVYADPSAALLVLGVTGTNGKTTTVYLLEAGLRTAGRRTGLVGTIETRVDGEAMASARTTPEATDLQALFALMRERAVDAVAMEVSSHALALGRVDGITFDFAAFTNLSQDHLDFHHDMADYFAAKAQLFTPGHSRRAVVCIDDEWGRELAKTATVPVITTGRTPDADWRRLDDVDAGAAGGQTRLVDPDGNHHEVACGLIGMVNLTNAALAYVTLVAAGIDPDHARNGIASLSSIPGRMEPIAAGQPYVVLVDYAHTPEAVATLLADARRLTAPEGRVLVVIGCGGDRDRAKRPAMGAAAAIGSDLAIFTNDNPRSEDPHAIIAAMRAGLPAGSDVVVEPDRRSAIGLAVEQARAGDVVVVAGKGHEQGQEIAGTVIEFDDRVVVQAAIAADLAGSAR